MAQKNVTLDSVINALKTVKDPKLSRDFMVLGKIKDLKIEADHVSLKLNLPQNLYSYADQIELQLKQALIEIAGASEVQISRDEIAPVFKKTSGAKQTKPGIPGVKHIIAVSSGKGGVGKSTVSVNLACSLAKLGHSVGLLDSDVYGPNIPTMMGANEPPKAYNDEKRGELIVPVEAHGVKVMSMGLLTRGDQPAVWRGPMLHSVVQQFLMKVDWGALDFLIVDMPPGTGDVQLSLTQLVPVSGVVVVTTPQEVSLQDVRKAILMFEKVGVPILGVVENMSYFLCDNCSTKHFIFGSEGGKLLAQKFRTNLLAELPLEVLVREGGDAGTPVVMRSTESAVSKAFLNLALKLTQEFEGVELAEIELKGF